MKLLLDLGNTRVKWGVAGADGRLRDAQAHDWDELPVDILQRTWADLAPPPQGVWAASVVDAEREARVEAAVLAHFGVPVTWVRTPAQACGVRNSYAQPQILGVDRFLAMVAAHARGHAPCVLVHVGTTIVLDALTGEGQHLGGLIGPGPHLMRQSVLDATVRVRPQMAGRLVDAATNTADAVESGCWNACAALVDRFVARMAPALGGAPVLLLSGGDAGTLLPLVEHTAVLFPNATLNGLVVWAESEPDGTGDSPRERAACSGD